MAVVMFGLVCSFFDLVYTFNGLCQVQRYYVQLLAYCLHKLSYRVEISFFL